MDQGISTSIKSRTNVDIHVYKFSCFFFNHVIKGT